MADIPISIHQTTQNDSSTTSTSSLQFVSYTSSIINSSASSDPENISSSTAPSDSYISDTEDEQLSTQHSNFQEKWWHTTFSLTNLTRSENSSTITSPTFEKLPDNMTEENILSTLQQLLDQKTVKLTPKICEFLHRQTVLDLFLSFLSRTPPLSSEYDDENEHWPLDSDRHIHPDVLRERDASLQPTIYSYRLMDTLCSINPINSKFVEDHFEQIVQALFSVLKLNSDGNFFHFKKVFESFLSRYSGLFLDATIYTRQRHPLMFQLLPFIHHPPILSCLILVLSYKSPENHDEIIQRFVYLHSIGFWDCVFSLLTSSVPDLISATVDFFHNILEKIIELDSADHFLLPLATDPHILDLWDSALQSSNPGTTEATITILHSIIVGLDKRSEFIFYPIQKCESVWFHLAQQLSTALVTRIESITRFFLSTKLSPTRFIVLELLSCVLKQHPQKVDQPSLAFWKACVSQFFNSPNPLCLPSIFKLLTLAVEYGNEEVLQKVLVKQKLIHRLLDAFEGLTLSPISSSTPPPSPPFSTLPSPTLFHSPSNLKPSVSPDLRVFSILLLQHISIVAEIQEPRRYLFQLTRAHSRLRNATPSLLNSIKEQLEFNYFWPEKLGKPPLPQVSPNKLTLDFLDMSQCANLPNDVEVDTEDTWLPKYALNIGLGSYFMEHLNALLQSIPMKDPQRETYFKAMVHEIHCFQALCDAGKDHFDLDTIKDETIETIANLSLTDDKTFLSLSPSENNSQTTELLPDVQNQSKEQPVVQLSQNITSNDSVITPETSSHVNNVRDTASISMNQNSHHPGDRIATIYD